MQAKYFCASLQLGAKFVVLYIDTVADHIGIMCATCRVFQLTEVQQRYLQTVVGVKNNC